MIYRSYKVGAYQDSEWVRLVAVQDNANGSKHPEFTTEPVLQAVPSVAIVSERKSMVGQMRYIENYDYQIFNLPIQPFVENWTVWHILLAAAGTIKW